MDFSFSDLNFNSIENLPGFEACAAFTVNSASVFRKVVDIVPAIVDDNLSYILWGRTHELKYPKLRTLKKLCALCNVCKFMQTP